MKPRSNSKSDSIRVSWKILAVFIAIGVIFIGQMIWWIILFIENVTGPDAERYKLMIIYEGGFFIMLIIAGLVIIYRILRREIMLKQQFKDFFAGFSHELKTPVASIKLQVETMLTHELERQKQLQLLENAREDADKLELAMNNILDAFRYEAGAPALHASPLHLDSWLEDTLQEQVQVHGPDIVNLTLDFESNAEAAIDHHSMTTVFSNLIQNSVRYAHGNSAAVSVSTQLESGNIRITYSDDGVGITAEEAEEIFSKFYRSDTASSLHHKGSGIGLYLARKIIEQHRGTITARPAGGQRGTAFEITLPKAEK